MPLYEYKCSCGETFDTVQTMREPKLTKCLEINDCDKKGTLQRIIGKPLILSDDIGRGFKRMKDKDLYKELDE
tara:strand:- start:191 stop:409 length:219 start_codon:yes stop_codon:yes gene_type:complete